MNDEAAVAATNERRWGLARLHVSGSEVLASMTVPSSTHSSQKTGDCPDDSPHRDISLHSPRQSLDHTRPHWKRPKYTKPQSWLIPYVIPSPTLKFEIQSQPRNVSELQNNATASLTPTRRIPPLTCPTHRPIPPSASPVSPSHSPRAPPS
jgi:hypothetical protein